MPQGFDSTGSAAPRLPGDDFAIPFAEAIAWARERKAMLPEEFYGARLQAVRARGFAIAGLAALDQVQQVADSLDEATANGTTLRDWKRSLPAEAFSLGKARIELIFRNAVQTHYGIGRTLQQRANAGNRPYLMWDAINDSRTRPTHRAMDNYIAPVDDPIWQRWHPPAGHNCRCTRISLTESQARARGYPKGDPGVEPDAGWEGDPTEGNEDLVRVIRARQAACLTTFAPKQRRRPWNADCTHQGADSLRAMQFAQSYADPMPDPRALGLPLLSPTTDSDANWRAFMAALGTAVGREAEVISDFGARLMVSKNMFTDHKTGASKVDKRGRAAYLLYIAETILRPDEAWISTGSFGDRTLVLLSRFVRGSDLFGVVAAFKERAAAWEGWSGFQAAPKGYFLALRDGVLIYRRVILNP